MAAMVAVPYPRDLGWGFVFARSALVSLDIKNPRSFAKNAKERGTRLSLLSELQVVFSIIYVIDLIVHHHQAE